MNLINNTELKTAEKIDEFLTTHYKTEWDYIIMPTFKEIHTNDRVKWFILEDGDRWRALVAIESLGGLVAYLEKTVVHKDFRRQGYGQRLNKDIIAYCRKWKFSKICTEIFVDNIPNIFLKLKLGYTIEGKIISNCEMPDWYNLGLNID